MTYHPPSPSTSDVRSVMQPRGGRPARIEKAKDPRGTLMRMLPYFSHFRGAVVVVFVFVLIYTLLGLVGPYLMGVAIDHFIATKQLAGLAGIAILMLVVYLLQ